MIEWEESSNVWKAYDNRNRYLGYVTQRLNSFLAVKFLVKKDNLTMITENSCVFEDLEQAKAFVLN